MTSHYNLRSLRKRQLKSYETEELLTKTDNTDDVISEVASIALNRKTFFTKCKDTVFDIAPLTIVILLSIVTRLYQINKSPIVVWDEAHFGKFANWYIQRKFYFDVHPPFGKLLIAFFGWMSSYDGSFSFESGKTYDENVPVRNMRIACALIGSTIAPLMYGVFRNLKMRKETAFLVASMIIFDNATLTISKFILLDPILLAGTAATLFSATKLNDLWHISFSRKWRFWMFVTGLFAGLTTSVKWVGLFTYAFVGLFTVTDLWELLKTAKRSPRNYTKHWMYRILFLIIVPIVTYGGTFLVHFIVLSRSGPGDSQMSSRFQSSLIGSQISSGPPLIAFSSAITLRNNGHGGGLLHSHNHLYPEGSKQPQVTLYGHRDLNNYWIIEKPWKTTEKETDYIHDGEIIRLFHNATRHNLHSHAIPAPISVYTNEVSTYGNLTNGDVKDHWVVEIDSRGVPSNDPEKTGFERVQILNTRFRLRHALLGCYLATSGNKLPDWGFDQREVVCTADKGSRSTWNVEEHINDFLKDVVEEGIAEIDKGKSFLDDFLDLNMAMFTGNNALTPKIGKKDILASTPIQWPFAQVGIRLCNWNDETSKYYLLGNPLVWWTGTLSIVLFAMKASVIMVSRQISGHSSFVDDQFMQRGCMFLVGWILHYAPFAVMGRVTYLHHYFPALLISLMSTAHLCDRGFNWISDTRKSTIISTVLFVVYGGVFLYFSPLSYGFTGKAQEMEGRKWLDWNI